MKKFLTSVLTASVLTILPVGAASAASVGSYGGGNNTDISNARSSSYDNSSNDSYNNSSSNEQYSNESVSYTALYYVNYEATATNWLKSMQNVNHDSSSNESANYNDYSNFMSHMPTWGGGSNGYSNRHEMKW